MKKYIVNGPKAIIANGTVGLTLEQADRRVNQVKPLGDDLFTVIHPLEFKHGESFLWDGEPGKGSPLNLIDEREVNPDNQPPAQFQTPDDYTGEFYAVIKGFQRKNIKFQPGEVVPLELHAQADDIAQLLAEGKIEGPVDIKATLAGPEVDENGNPVNNAPAV